MVGLKMMKSRDYKDLYNVVTNSTVKRKRIAKLIKRLILKIHIELRKQTPILYITMNQGLVLNRTLFENGMTVKLIQSTIYLIQAEAY